MSLDIQFKLKDNPDYLKYLRENSWWYKVLNRNPNEFKRFEEEVKKNLHLNRVDKIEKTLSTIEMLEKILVTFE